MNYLDEFKSLAYDAFRWTSFDPENRAERTLSDHEFQLKIDLEAVPEKEQERYISNYKKYLSTWLSARSRCASSMIAGGSGFNTTRAEKANRSEYNRWKEFSDWRDRALRTIRRNAKKAKTQDQSLEEQWVSLRNSINSSCQTIFEINTGVNQYSSKALFINSIYNKIETYMKKGEVEIVNKAIELIRFWNIEKTPIVTERHKVFRLLEMAENVRANKGMTHGRENKEIPIIGGKIIYNYAADRLQIAFDERPPIAVITALKRKSFKWAPSVGVWQRQLTGNAIAALEKLLSEKTLYNELGMFL